MKKSILLIALVSLCLVFASCDNDSSDPTTGVTLDQTTLEIYVGEDVQLNVTVEPEDAADKTVSWSSSNKDVATVDNHGNVHAVAAGDAIITVTTNDGGKSAKCTVNVSVDTRTFKAVYNTNNDANALTFYYDNSLHIGEGVLYDNLPPGATTYTSWGYDGIRGNINSVKIDPSVAGYKGLTSTAYMFFNMIKAESISGAEYLDVSNVTDMTYMFCAYGRNSTSLTAVPDVSGWKTDKVTKMVNLFSSYGQGSTSLTAPPDVSKWNTGNVTDMGTLFSGYGRNSTSLTAVPDVSGWKTDKVTKMGTLFANYGDANKDNINCVLDLTGWNLANLTNNNNVFHNFSPNTFKVTIPAKTDGKSNDTGNWYYGNGGNGGSIIPPTNKEFKFTLAAN